MATKGTSGRLKDVLLEHVLRDIRELQNAQSDLSQMEDVVTLSSRNVQAFCEHMDRILLHGLRSSEMGYWPVVSYFTRLEAVRDINGLNTVKTSVGRGRAWLYLALNEQSLECYVTMLLNNQDFMETYYLKESFLRDIERLLVLQTLVAGLDYISFNLPLESVYLDFGASRASSTVGTLQSIDIMGEVEPSFISIMTPNKSMVDKEKLQLEGRKTQTPGWGRDTIRSGTEQSTSSNDIFSLRGSLKSGMVGGPGEAPTRGCGEGRVSTALEGERTEDPNESLYPHRTLSQLSQGTWPSGALSNSSTYDGGEDREEELVVRTAKKNKAKKKKKRKKKDSESLTQSQLKSGVVSGANQDEVGSSGVKTDTDCNRVILAHSDKHEEVDGVRREEDDEGKLSGEDGNLEPPVEKDVPNDEISKMTEHENRVCMRHGDEEHSKDEREAEELMWLPSIELSSTNCEMEKSVGNVPLLEPTTPTDSQGFGIFSVADKLKLAEEEFEEAGVGVKDEPINVYLKSYDTHMNSEQSVVSSFATGDLGRNSIPDSFATFTAEDISQGRSSGGAEKESYGVAEDWLHHTFSHEHKAEPMVYDRFPERPQEITLEDRKANDIIIDDNTRVVISLDVLFNEDEEVLQLMQVATPTGVGQQRNCYLLVTSQATYIMKKDGIEGQYSRDVGIGYKDFKHIVVGLGWQSLVFVYSSSSTIPGNVTRYILLTGSEAISRSIVDSICSTAISNFHSAVLLTHDNEERVAAIEGELIKLGSQTSMDMVEYFLVNWEQLVGESIIPTSSAGGSSLSGYLYVKTTNLIGLTTWKPAYFNIRDGHLYQYSNEEDELPKVEYTIRHCGGCQRSLGEGKQFAFSVLDKDSSVMVVLAASNEDELIQWNQALCATAVMSPTQCKTCFSCTLLLTQNMIHVLQEDWTNQSVKLVASCKVTDVDGVSVDNSLPLYCTISYDQENEQGVWLVCFNKEYELRKFKIALAGMWREEFQVDLEFTEVADVLTRQRAHEAVLLMQGSRFRSDSMTRGRTELTYSSQY